MGISDQKEAGALALCLMLAPGVVAAFEGCYVRDYSDAHLAKHPAQVVDRITLDLYRQATGEVVAEMWVVTARQGHAARAGEGGKRFSQFLICWDDAGRPVCGVECDGGKMDITRLDANGLTFQTSYLLVGDAEACGGVVDLAERPGQPVSYRLDRVEPAVCAGERVKAGQ